MLSYFGVRELVTCFQFFTVYLTVFHTMENIICKLCVYISFKKYIDTYYIIYYVSNVFSLTLVNKYVGSISCQNQ